MINNDLIQNVDEDQGGSLLTHLKFHRPMCFNCIFSMHKIAEIIVVEISTFKDIISSYKPKGLINQKIQNWVPFYEKT